MMRRAGPALLGVVLSAASVAATAQSPASPTQAAPRGMQMVDILRQLSPQGQLVFRDSWLASEREAMQRRRQATRAAEDAVLAALAANPFNPEDLRRAYAEQRKVAFENQRDRSEHLVSVLKRLSPLDRQIVANQLRAMRARREEAMSPPR